jgi:hypothetical protein
VPIVRRKVAALIGAVAILSTVMLLTGGAAQAQTGYPPGTSVPPPCVAGNVNAGNVSVLQTITFTLCGDFTGTVTVSVNGAVVLTKTATGGAVVVVVTISTQTVAEIEDPVKAAIVCGNNVVSATGPGTPGQSTGNFNLLCTTTTTTKSGLAFTGANILRTLLIALGLIVLGALLIIFQRRRHQHI